MNYLLPIVFGLAAVLLARSLFRRMAADRLTVFTERRRPTSLVVSRGEIVDGNRHLEVALALTESAVIYENSDVQGSVERSTIDEVEYENELTTGQPVYDGKVMRLRCFRKTFEFVIPVHQMREWEVLLPAHRATS